MNPPPTVVKVGGSLLDWPELPRALTAWLSQQPPGCYLLLGGGGNFCEAVREADQLHSLGESFSHDLCIDCLAVTAKLLAQLTGLPRLTWRRPEQPPSWPAVAVFDCQSFLQEVEPISPGERLPRSWSATTDSIAARLAELLAAPLVLLKSCPAPSGSLAELAAAGYVDDHFPVAARSLPSVRCVNLREFSPP